MKGRSCDRLLKSTDGKNCPKASCQNQSTDCSLPLTGGFSVHVKLRNNMNNFVWSEQPRTHSIQEAGEELARLHHIFTSVVDKWLSEIIRTVSDIVSRYVHLSPWSWHSEGPAVCDVTFLIAITWRSTLCRSETIRSREEDLAVHIARGRRAAGKFFWERFFYRVKWETACSDTSHYTLEQYWGAISIYIPPDIWQSAVSVHERKECHQSNGVDYPVTILHFFLQLSP